MNEDDRRKEDDSRSTSRRVDDRRQEDSRREDDRRQEDARRAVDDRRKDLRRAEDVDAYAKDRDFTDLTTEVEALKKQVEGLVKEREQQLRWGIVVLGTAALGMAGWIFNLITGKLGH